MTFTKLVFIGAALSMSGLFIRLLLYACVESEPALGAAGWWVFGLFTAAIVGAVGMVVRGVVGKAPTECNENERR